MTLCAACKKLDLRTLLLSTDENWPTSPDGESDYYLDERAQELCYYHSDNSFQLQRSASVGCRLCGFIFSAFERKGPDSAEVAGNLPIVLVCGTEVTEDTDDPALVQQGRRLAPQIRAYLVGTEEGLIEICELDLSISDEGAPGELSDLPFYPLNKLSTDLNDASCTALAFNWYQTCLKNHDCLAPRAFGSKSLTRFIDVGNVRKRPFLVEFAPRTIPKYWATLSYCWGQKPSQKLTKYSVSDLMLGLEIDKFDATIRDAILVARGLGIQHLWIDALCIFQDDESDWLEQSSHMSDIYGMSTVTLAAVDSSRVSQGFLSRRDQGYVAIPWRALGDNGENSQDYHQQHVYLSESWDLRNDRLDGPWAKRGWTFQEGLLPNRILFYTSDQMVWKCRKEILYERGVRSEPQVEVVRGIFGEGGGTHFWELDLFTKFKLLHWYVQGPESRRPDDRYRIWHSLMEDYCVRQLTQPRDRLVAISGLARMYADVIEDDQYCAGLWKSDMIRGLLWRAAGATLFDASIANQSSDCKLNTPSWSWASIGSSFPIRNPWAHIMDFRKLARVEEVSIRLKEPSNPFGDVISASISISAPIRRFSKLYHEDWQSPSAPLPAFERHVSRVIERDYSERAKEFSGHGCYAALLMLQEFPSFDHRVDVLMLEGKTLDADSEEEACSVFRRLGVITLSYINQDTIASPALLQSVRKMEKSVRARLNPGRGPRRVNMLRCVDVFREYEHDPWPRQTVTVV